MSEMLTTDTTNKIETFYFSFSLYELFLGGSGRILSFGPVTLRMILFTIGLIWFSVRILKNPNKKFTLSMVAVFCSMLLIGCIVGLYNNAPKGLIFTDVKQLLYFLSIICFSYCINSKNQIDTIVKIIKNATILLAVSYLICYILLQINVFKMTPFYNTLSVAWLHDEFMFRGTGGNFFYKGFFYLGIGIFFFIFDKPSVKNGSIALVIYVALFLTLLRWLLATMLFVYACTLLYKWLLKRCKFSFLISKEMIFHILLFSCMLSIPIIFRNFYITTLGDKQESVDIRKQQLDQVKSEIFVAAKNNNTLEKSSKFNYIVGKGLGVGVPIRPVHMELTYLEIFFKQGIIGLSFWFFLLGYCVYNFRLIVKKSKEINTILPWITGILVIYLQSITNPLLVNSIGMSFVLIAMLILRRNTLIQHED